MVYRWQGRSTPSDSSEVCVDTHGALLEEEGAELWILEQSQQQVKHQAG